MAKPKKKAAKKKAATKKKTLGSRKPKDLPATYRALDGVRKELKSDITSVRLEMRAGFKEMDARFKQIDARFKQMDAKFDKMEVQFKKADSRFEAQNASTQRMLALLEEQYSLNKASYEGSESVRVKQDELTQRIEVLEAFQYDMSKKLTTS